MDQNFIISGVLGRYKIFSSEYLSFSETPNLTLK